MYLYACIIMYCFTYIVGRDYRLRIKVKEPAPTSTSFSMVGNESSADDNGVSLPRPNNSTCTGTNKWYYSHRFTTREQSIVTTTTTTTDNNNNDTDSNANALVAEEGSASRTCNTSTVALNPTHKRTHNSNNTSNPNRNNTTTSKTSTTSTSTAVTYPRNTTTNTTYTNNSNNNTSNSTSTSNQNNYNTPITQLTLQCLSCNDLANMVCKPCGHTFICYTCYTDLKNAPEPENKIKSCPKCRFSLTSELPLIHIKFENITNNSNTTNAYTLPTCRSYKGCDNTVYIVLSCGHMCYCELCINKSVYTRCAECNTGFNQMSTQKIKFD